MARVDGTEAVKFDLRQYGRDVTEDGQVGRPTHVRPPAGRRRPCKSCGAPVVDVKTPDGKWMPLDADSGQRVRVTKGGDLRVVLEDGSVKAAVKAYARGGSVLAWTSHFATCPDADKHRKGGRR